MTYPFAERTRKTICILLALCTVLLTLTACHRKTGDKISDSSGQVSSALESEESQGSSSDEQTSESSSIPTTPVNSQPSPVQTDADLSPAGSSSSIKSDAPAKQPIIWVDPAPEKNRKQIIVSKVVHQNNRTYIEHNGKPYLQYGVQAVYGRSAYSTEKDYEAMFQKTAEIGFQNILVQVRWRDIEPEYNRYTMFGIQRILKYAKKYGLTVELLWFGDNVCGAISFAPDYVLKDSKKYPLFEGNGFAYSNRLLLDRECKALSKIMDYLYDNDPDRRVAVMQILNEPNYSSSFEKQKKDSLNALDRLGKTVKNSPYSIVTRVNFVISESFLQPEKNTLPEDVLALDGIDAVGPDVYSDWLSCYSGYGNRFSKTTDAMLSNPSAIAEGPGNMYCYLKQVLTAFAANSGYNCWELRRDGEVDCDFGIFRQTPDTKPSEWVYRDGSKKVQYTWTIGNYTAESNTYSIIDLNKTINKVREQIASCPMDQFLTLLRDRTGKIGDVSIHFAVNETDVDRRVGAAFLAADGYYYFFSPCKEATFTLEKNTVAGNASEGAFVNGKWVENSAVSLKNGNTLTTNCLKVYRIPVQAIR